MTRLFIEFNKKSHTCETHIWQVGGCQFLTLGITSSFLHFTCEYSRPTPSLSLADTIAWAAYVLQSWIVMSNVWKTFVPCWQLLLTTCNSTLLDWKIFSTSPLYSTPHEPNVSYVCNVRYDPAFCLHGQSMCESTFPHRYRLKQWENISCCNIKEKTFQYGLLLM